jgi:uncharacterized membrane protein
MLVALTLLVCIGAATVGGVFFAFSSFVMKALAGLPTSQGVAAMQRINVVVLNPVFLGLFVGTAVLALALVTQSLLSWGAPRSPWLVAAASLYLLGSVAVTGAFNVPRNERLAHLDPGSPEAAAYWPGYVRSWTRWNHVRAVASVASAICAAVALLGSASIPWT